MAQKSVTQLEEEYVFAVEQLKKLASEAQNAVPKDLKERIKDGIRYAVSQLEMMGTPKRQIIGKLYTDLGGDENSFYKLRNIYYIIGKDEYDPDGAENANLQNANASNIYEQRNIRWIDLCDRGIKFYQNFRKKLTENPYEEVLEPKYADECHYTLNNLFDTADECLDFRETVPLVENHTLFCEITKFGIAHAAESIQNKVKEVSFTPKQTTNYRLGQVRKLHPLYDPHDEEEAISSPAKFFGVRCEFMRCNKCEHGNKLTATACVWCGSTELTKTGCKSWRVKLGNQADERYTVHCFACQNDFIPTTKPLPRTNNEYTLNVMMSPNVSGSVEMK